MRPIREHIEYNKEQEIAAKLNENVSVSFSEMNETDISDLKISVPLHQILCSEEMDIQTRKECLESIGLADKMNERCYADKLYTALSVDNTPYILVSFDINKLTEDKNLNNEIYFYELSEMDKLAIMNHVEKLYENLTNAAATKQEQSEKEANRLIGTSFELGDMFPKNTDKPWAVVVSLSPFIIMNLYNGFGDWEEAMEWKPKGHEELPWYLPTAEEWEEIGKKLLYSEHFSNYIPKGLKESGLPILRGWSWTNTPIGRKFVQKLYLRDLDFLSDYTKRKERKTEHGYIYKFCHIPQLDENLTHTAATPQTTIEATADAAIQDREMNMLMKLRNNCVIEGNETDKFDQYYTMYINKPLPPYIIKDIEKIPWENLVSFSCIYVPRYPTEQDRDEEKEVFDNMKEGKKHLTIAFGYELDSNGIEDDFETRYFDEFPQITQDYIYQTVMGLSENLTSTAATVKDISKQADKLATNRVEQPTDFEYFKQDLTDMTEENDPSEDAWEIKDEQIQEIMSNQLWYKDKLNDYIIEWSEKWERDKDETFYDEDDEEVNDYSETVNYLLKIKTVRGFKIAFALDGYSSMLSYYFTNGSIANVMPQATIVFNGFAEAVAERNFSLLLKQIGIFFKHYLNAPKEINENLTNTAATQQTDLNQKSDEEIINLETIINSICEFLKNHAQFHGDGYADYFTKKPINIQTENPHLKDLKHIYMLRLYKTTKYNQEEYFIIKSLEYEYDDYNSNPRMKLRGELHIDTSPTEDFIEYWGRVPSSWMKHRGYLGTHRGKMYGEGAYSSDIIKYWSYLSDEEKMDYFKQLLIGLEKDAQ